ncbi:hypothetical protein SpiGrapes_0189 [Sphaerochaeta pleomorpha str. Grapes]|uniref:Lipoprotein n=1 Tax=Sphaerochaeta pleomorpha (strain ATCC BAA-1885 / DSM 22778 / Grapes) TaxID=158190 RepID=G8QU83_SPHPG|nr:hypothetical protein [Sphaerochaeta pleomorpha]AEV28053.1 hypothetical protein SpiGrapes_0189 [Sphaerochaeta pleomorpha str. Grapes]
MHLPLPKKTVLVLLLLSFAVSALFACEMVFHLSGPDSSNVRVLPGSTIALQQGAEYSLQVEFTEDHRNCTIPPEDTLFLLDGSKWKTSKTNLDLVLLQDIRWEEMSRYLNFCTLSFTADKKGQSVLQIIRDCRKGGYDESFTFLVG